MSVLGIVASLLLGACNSVQVLRLAPGPGWVGTWNVWELSVKPVETDAAIQSKAASHLVYVPADARTAPRNLFVFLPGTHGTPTQYSDFLKAAARHGQHVIGLAYPNRQAARPVCNQSADRDCHGNLREEIVLGVDASPYVNVDRANSIEGRLVSLLKHLAEEYPEQGWDAYLYEETDLPRWNRIAISGYSQGAGHAAYIARNVLVLKAGLYSGPGDVNTPLAGRPARWLEGASITPPERIAGFTHAGDNVAQLNRVRANWKAMGIAGDPVNIDHGKTAPIAASLSRQYVTRLPAAQPDDYANHAATIRDTYIPRDERQLPLYLPVWQKVSFP